MAAAAERGAARIRRRRGVAAVAGVGALVAVVAMVVLVVADRRHADRQPPVSTPTERRPGQITLGVDPASGYVVTDQDIDADSQQITFLIPLAGPDKFRNPAAAKAIDPDAGFDPGWLRQANGPRCPGTRLVRRRLPARRLPGREPRGSVATNPADHGGARLA